MYSSLTNLFSLKSQLEKWNLNPYFKNGGKNLMFYMSMT